jgi:hypothetical protein
VGTAGQLEKLREFPRNDSKALLKCSHPRCRDQRVIASHLAMVRIIQAAAHPTTSPGRCFSPRHAPQLNDNTVRTQGLVLEIPPGPGGRDYAQARVAVRQPWDGTWRIYHRDRLLATLAAPTGLPQHASAVGATLPHRVPALRFSMTSYPERLTELQQACVLDILDIAERNHEKCAIDLHDHANRRAAPSAMA